MKTPLLESFYNWYRSIIRNPKYRWWIIVASLVYLLSPLDISPDVFPVLGWIDDGIIATLLVSEVSQVLLERLKAKPTNSSEQPSQTTNASRVDTVEVNAVAID